MIRVSPRAHRTEDRAGDPLDGLVNLFDLGIVLSVGFLIAALSSLQLADSFTDADGSGAGPTSLPSDAITAPSGATLSQLPTTGVTVVGQGEPIGQVYRLKDGRIVYVVAPSSGPSATPTPDADGLLPAGSRTGLAADLGPRPLPDAPDLGHAAGGRRLDRGGAGDRPADRRRPGVGRFRGRGTAIVLSNAGSGCPRWWSVWSWRCC